MQVSNVNMINKRELETWKLNLKDKNYQLVYSVKKMTIILCYFKLFKYRKDNLKNHLDMFCQ